MHFVQFGQRDRRFHVPLWATVMLGLQQLAAFQAGTNVCGMIEKSELLFQATHIPSFPPGSVSIPYCINFTFSGLKKMLKK